MNQAQYNEQLLDFLGKSPTPFHAVKNMQMMLEAQGFSPLVEEDSWNIQPGGRYYVVRNGSAIIAFVQGKNSALERGVRMVGAHTDSPCLKVKPQPEIKKSGYFQVGVEVYGGALLNPWFDRDLSIAGRVVFTVGSGRLQHALVDFKKPVAVIPSLAIHLDREANSNKSINSQKQIPPILFRIGEHAPDSFRSLLAAEVLTRHDPLELQVLDYELCLYDCQPPALVGVYDDFIAGARLDNLLSCYTGMQALLEAGDQVSTMLVCNDHEEVGSASACGAQGPMLKSVLQRLYPSAEEMTRVISHSMMISADNAHGVHPNFADKHDGNHGPQINEGPVIKVNSNQRYATSSITSSLFRQLCQQEGVPVQVFVNRTDLGCGSTIGPITASNIGVPTLDVGVPTFAMHSIRELAGAKDAHNLYRVLKAFYNYGESMAIS